VIDVANLYKGFGALEVLKDVSLTVGSKEVVCIIGPSGSGKSTLLRCINFLEQPDRGTIRINGVPAYYDMAGDEIKLHSRKNIASVRAKLGMVFQDFNLFPHSRCWATSSRRHVTFSASGGAKPSMQEWPC
jgi:polar amino acid transport system ATP-binding protein